MIWHGITAFVLKNLFGSYSGFYTTKEIAPISSGSAPSSAFADGARAASDTAGASIFSQTWIWFFAGALFSLMIYFLWNWVVYRKT